MWFKLMQKDKYLVKKMKTEVPVLKRCCCCLPLRRGVLLFAYLKVVFLVLLVVFGVLEIIFFVKHMTYFSKHALIGARLVIELVVITMSFASNILLIVAAHKKSIELLKVTYKCELVAAVSVFVVLVSGFLFDLSEMWEMFTDTYKFWKYLYKYTLAGLVFVGLQLYIIASIRSEVIKLESKHEFRFVNHAVDAECKYYENNPPDDSATKIQILS